MTPYEILGVPAVASAEEVKAAWRRKAGEAHPDRRGGDGERMARINEAYAVLSDPARRQRFDETGETRQESTVQDEAIAALATVFKSALDQDEAGVLEFARMATTQSRHQIAAARAAAVSRQAKLSNKRERVRVKGDAQNMLHAIVDAQIAALEKQVMAMDRALLVADAISTLLDIYEEDEMRPQWRPVFQFASTGTTGTGW